MPPRSKTDMGCVSQVILEISDKLGKIDIQTDEEQCTYNIEDDNNGDDDYVNNEINDENNQENDDSPESNTSNTSNNTKSLENCAKIKEKGPVRQDRINNNRLQPFLRNSTSGGQLIYNNDENIQFNNIFEIPAYNNLTSNHGIDGSAECSDISFNDLRSGDIQQLLCGIYDANNVVFNDFNESNAVFNENNTVFNENTIFYETNGIFDESNGAHMNNNSNGNYSFDDQSQIFSENSSTYEPQTERNIPVVVGNFPRASTNRAEQTLSNYIDQNKKLKQTIWILVNTQIESDLIATLRAKIASLRFTENDLNYIYAIIIRLMKKDCDVDGKGLLLEYFKSDGDVLFKIAIKGNILLMDFILEVFQNLGMNPNQFNVAHKIVGYSHVDLSAILNNLLDKTFDNKPSLKMFDVNCVDSAEQTILMIVVRNILLDRGLFEVNMNYLDVILHRNPRIDNVSRDGRTVFHDVFNCVRCFDIVEKFLCYYDQSIIDNMMNQVRLSGPWANFQQ